MKVVAIIPAAGLGTRMASAPESKGKKPVASKQFTELGGTPILIHTLRKFAASPEVSEIYVALRRNDVSGFQTRLEQDERNILPKKTHFVEGGEHRQHSVANVIAAILAAPEDIVVDYDVVGVFFTAEFINDEIDDADI